MRNVLFFILLSVLTLSVAATCQSPKEKRVAAALPCNHETLKKAVNSANLVVVARLTEVGPPMGFWSGQVPVVQRVQYKTEEVIKGEVARESVIDVGHYVIAKSSTADAEKPQLSSRLFTIGGRFILFLEKDPNQGYVDNPARSDKSAERYLSLDSCGLLSASEENIRAVKDSINSGALNR
jgi:hypothetical protein